PLGCHPAPATEAAHGAAPADARARPGWQYLPAPGFPHTVPTPCQTSWGTPPARWWQSGPESGWYSRRWHFAHGSPAGDATAKRRNHPDHWQNRPCPARSRAEPDAPPPAPATPPDSA